MGSLVDERGRWDYSVTGGTTRGDVVMEFIDAETGDPTDLSIYTEIRQHWRATMADDEPSLVLSTEDGSIVNSGVLGTLTWFHPRAETAELVEANAFKSREYQHNVLGFTADEDAPPDELFAGIVLLEPSATRLDEGS